MSNLNEYTVPQLQEKLEAAGIDFDKSAFKADLIKLLEDANASESNEGKPSTDEEEESGDQSSNEKKEEKKTISVDKPEAKTETPKDDQESAKKTSKKKAPQGVKTPTKKEAAVDTVKLGTKTYRFKAGIKKLQIAGEVLPVADILKDEPTMRSLVRANSPFVESVNK